MNIKDISELDMLLLARVGAMQKWDSVIDKIAENKRLGLDENNDMQARLIAAEALYDDIIETLSGRINELKRATRECKGETLFYKQGNDGYATAWK